MSQFSKTKTLKLNEDKLRSLLKFEPHPKQLEVLEHKTRFTTLCFGRRSGKTYLAAYLALKKLLTSNNNIWVVAPTYDLARRSWDYLVQWVTVINKNMGQFIRINKSTFTMESYSGSKLELKSADNPSSLLGIGLNLLIMDEAARIPEDIWRTYLYPTLSDRQGDAVFISTPFGKNWFYEMMLKGTDTDPKFSDYSYFHMATRENTSLPHLVEEAEKAKNELPMNDWLQEYEAEFIEGAGSAFRGVRDVLYNVSFTGFPFQAEQFNEDHVYQGGLDLARLTDFTVETIVDKAQEKFKVVYIDRFNEIDWKIQKPRMKLGSEKYRNPPINTEVNNIGDSVIGDLSGNFIPFKTSNDSKKDLINNLAILIEQKKILIPNIPVLVAELESFSYEILKSGVIRYAAPVGYHDDLVMSLALACKDLKDPYVKTTYETTHTLPSNFYRNEEY